MGVVRSIFEEEVLFVDSMKPVTLVPLIGDQQYSCHLLMMFQWSGIWELIKELSKFFVHRNLPQVILQIRIQPFHFCYWYPFLVEDHLAYVLN